MIATPRFVSRARRAADPGPTLREVPGQGCNAIGGLWPPFYAALRRLWRCPASGTCRAPSELHLRRDLDRLAVVAEVEERALGEAEHAREQGGREDLDAGVVLAHR